MSDERAIINQLERLEIGIRAAEKEIVNLIYENGFELKRGENDGRS